MAGSRNTPEKELRVSAIVKMMVNTSVWGSCWERGGVSHEPGRDIQF